MSACLRPLLIVSAMIAVVAPPAQAQSSSFGQLTGEAGCIVQRGIEELAVLEDIFDVSSDVPEGCGRAGGLLRAHGVTLSPDQEHVYVAAGGNAAFGGNAVATFRRDRSSGELSAVGCVSDDGGDGRYGSDGACANGDALLGAVDIAISSDGRQAYVASSSSYGLAWFDRDLETGELTQRGCFKAVPRGGRCEWAPWLDGARAVVVAPDGDQVYIAASPSDASPGASDAISWFDRDEETGTLTYGGCVSATGSDGGCLDVAGLQGVDDLAMSRDGDRLYASAAYAGAVTSFVRGTDGGLTQDGCAMSPRGVGACTDAVGVGGATAVDVSPNGRDVYVAAFDYSDYIGTLAIFRQSGGTLRQTGCVAFDADEDDLDEDESSAEGGSPDRLRDCLHAPYSEDITDVAVAGDGGSVVVAADGGLYSFARDRESGALTPNTCAESYDQLAACFEARGIGFSTRIATSDDGRNVYVSTAELGAIAVMGPAVGAASTARLQHGARAARLRITCPLRHRGRCQGRVAITSRWARSSVSRFSVARGSASTVSVSLDRRFRMHLRRHRTVRMVATLTDSTRRMRPIRRPVALRR